VANIENEAWLIVRKAQAEAEQIKGLAQVRRCKRVCRVCKFVSVDPTLHGTLSDPAQVCRVCKSVSVDPTLHGTLPKCVVCVRVSV
jgi:hypothetical protein